MISSTIAAIVLAVVLVVALTFVLLLGFILYRRAEYSRMQLARDLARDQEELAQLKRHMVYRTKPDFNIWLECFLRTWDFEATTRRYYGAMSALMFCMEAFFVEHLRSDADIAARLASLPPVPHRLPLNKLLQLVPNGLPALVKHLLGTILIQAITIDKDALEYTILPRGMVALLVEIPDVFKKSDTRSDKESERLQQLFGLVKRHLTHLEWTQLTDHLEPEPFRSEQGLQALKDRITTAFNCVADMGEFSEEDNAQYQHHLDELCENALQAGARLLFNTVEHRFDWTVSDIPDDPLVVVELPAITAITDDNGILLPEPRVLLNAYRWTSRDWAKHGAYHFVKRARYRLAADGANGELTKVENVQDETE